MSPSTVAMARPLDGPEAMTTVASAMSPSTSLSLATTSMVVAVPDDVTAASSLALTACGTTVTVTIAVSHRPCTSQIR